MIDSQTPLLQLFYLWPSIVLRLACDWGHCGPNMTTAQAPCPQGLRYKQTEMYRVFNCRITRIDNKAILLLSRRAIASGGYCEIKQKRVFPARLCKHMSDDQSTATKISNTGSRLLSATNTVNILHPIPRSTLQLNNQFNP